jgi:hypothetical protein
MFFNVSVGTKKTYLNLYASPDVKDALQRYAEREDRALSNLCERLLAWSAEWLALAGDSQTLMNWQARPKRNISPRISEETQEQMFTAIEALLEHAPSAVIEDVARYLTSKAGKYGESR